MKKLLLLSALLLNIATLADLNAQEQVEEFFNDAKNQLSVVEKEIQEVTAQVPCDLQKLASFQKNQKICRVAALMADNDLTGLEQLNNDQLEFGLTIFTITNIRNTPFAQLLLDPNVVGFDYAFHNALGLAMLKDFAKPNSDSKIIPTLINKLPVEDSADLFLVRPIFNDAK